jgi:hypothetical protein
MKLSARLTLLKKRKLAQAPQARPGQPTARRPGPCGWAWLVLGLAVAATSTLAVFELVIWNKVPPALVGTWEVDEGPQYGGTFVFSRTGDLVVHLKDKQTDYTIRSRAVVQGKTLRTTTQDGQSHRQETHVSTILELTADSLVLEFENGDVLRLVRRK